MGNIVFHYIQPTIPVFTMHPQIQRKYEGQTVAFSAVAIGNPGASYQWQFNGSNIGGATASSYSLSGLSTSSAGNYSSIATNTSGSATSAVAILTVATSEATLASPTLTNKQFTLS